MSLRVVGNDSMGLTIGAFLRNLGQLIPHLWLTRSVGPPNGQCCGRRWSYKRTLCLIRRLLFLPVSLVYCGGTAISVYRHGLVETGNTLIEIQNGCIEDTFSVARGARGISRECCRLPWLSTPRKFSKS